MKDKLLSSYFSKNPENTWIEKQMKQSRGYTLKTITDKSGNSFYPNNSDNSLDKCQGFISNIKKY